MSSVTQRPPLLTRLTLRLRIALSRLFGRVILSGSLQRFVFGPLMSVGTVVYAFAIAFGRTPRIKVPPDSAITPDLAELITRIQESREAPVRPEITERGRAVVQKMTWGTAGAAVLILVAIATSSKIFVGPAMSIATGCFAVTIPFLVAFGFAFSHQWDPARDPPSVPEIVNLNALIYGGQSLFAAGLTFLLWSFDVRDQLRSVPDDMTGFDLLRKAFPILDRVATTRPGAIQRLARRAQVKW